MARKTRRKPPLIDPALFAYGEKVRARAALMRAAIAVSIETARQFHDYLGQGGFLKDGGEPFISFR